jgi:hypothetical protein
MQYTKEQLGAMSDHDITLATAKKLGLETKVYTNRHASFVDAKNKHNSWDCFEPCNRWDDVMPIAIDNQISIEPHYNDVWIVRKGEIFSLGVNPRRAICEVFLMMEASTHA